MRALPLSLMILLIPSLALAHTGHEQGNFLSGMIHPFGGTDHVLAMVAVGLMATQMGGRALWVAPLSFVAAMVAGGVLGAAGVPIAAVEPMILASVLILGLLVAMAVRLPIAAMVPVLAVFGAAHGWAHGAEGPQGTLAVYAVGFVVSTVALHGLGIVLGRALDALSSRMMGGAAAVAGLALAVA